MIATLKSSAAALLICLVALLLPVTCIHVGKTTERARWQAAEVARERAAAETYAEHVRLGNRAAAAATERIQAEQAYADQLTTERRHAVLVTPAGCPARALAADPGPAGAHAPGAGRRADAPADAAPPPVAPVLLTADAVRLWNSALAGRDMPAGACGPAYPTSPACAAAAEVELADVWDNHAANAARCRIAAARYDALIDYLQKRTTRQP